jgi:hypothetical protein
MAGRGLCVTTTTTAVRAEVTLATGAPPALLTLLLLLTAAAAGCQSGDGRPARAAKERDPEAERIDDIGRFPGPASIGGDG